MSSSRIIKTGSPGNAQDEILTTGAGGPDSGRFQALDSLWQSGDGTVDTLVSLQDRKEQIKEEVAAMLAEAEARRGQIEKEAFDKGFAQGKKEALAMEKKTLAQKAAQFDQLMQVVEQERRKLYQTYEHDVVELLKVMVERMVFHEVSVNPLVIPACLKKALSYVVENSPVKVHLHSNDFNRIREAGLDDPELLQGHNLLELIEDPAISEGGCLLETDFGEVDGSLENRRERLFETIDQFFMQTLAET